jgi:hypothetical protein
LIIDCFNYVLDTRRDGKQLGFVNVSCSCPGGAGYE